MQKELNLEMQGKGLKRNGREQLLPSFQGEKLHLLYSELQSSDLPNCKQVLRTSVSREWMSLGFPLPFDMDTKGRWHCPQNWITFSFPPGGNGQEWYCGTLQDNIPLKSSAGKKKKKKTLWGIMELTFWEKIPHIVVPLTCKAFSGSTSLYETAFSHRDYQVKTQCSSDQKNTWEAHLRWATGSYTPNHEKPSKSFQGPRSTL